MKKRSTKKSEGIVELHKIDKMIENYKKTNSNKGPDAFKIAKMLLDSLRNTFRISKDR